MSQLMCLFIVASIYVQKTICEILKTPININFNDPIETFITSKNTSDPLSTHNCLIVPCQGIHNEQNCLIITKSKASGDCYTKQILSGLNFTNNTDLVTLEFSYYPTFHPQSIKNKTGLTIGWTNERDFYWIASEDRTSIKNGVNDSNPFVTINSYQQNTWNKIRTFIRLNQNEPFRIVFETFTESTDFAAQFLITNISIYDRGTCSDGCNSCISYQECLQCDTGILYQGACIDDLCYNSVGFFTLEKMSFGWTTESNGQYGVILKNIKISDCYQIKFRMNQNGEYQDSSNIALQLYQYYFTINKKTLNENECKFISEQQQSQIKEGYQCFYQLQILLSNTSINLLNISWSQKFFYNQNKTQLITTNIDQDNLQFNVLTQNSSLGTAIKQLKGQTLLCKTSTCRSYYTEPQTLYLNEIFYILVKLDEDLIELAADYKLQLVETLIVSSGSYFPIKNLIEIEKNMSAQIYSFKVPYAIQNCSILLNVQLVERPLDDLIRNSTSKRMLSSTQTNQQIIKDSETIQGSIQIKSIKYPEFWIINKKENLPFFVIGSSLGIIIFFIFLYWYNLSKPKKLKQIENEIFDNQISIIRVDDELEITKYKDIFNKYQQV